MLLGWGSAALAGMGPANVVVLYNGDDTDAIEVATAYGEARSLPPGHLCRVFGVDPTVAQVDFATFDSTVRVPLETCIAALPQAEEIDAIVTVRGLPYVVTLPSFVVGLEAALQIGRGKAADNGEIAGLGQIAPSGFAQASVPNPDYVGIGQFCDPADLVVTNPYGSWYRATCALQALDELPRAFARSHRHDLPSAHLTDELYVVSRLDGFDYGDALDLVERGVAADGVFPDASFLCMAGADEARAARDPECELTTRRLAEAGFTSDWVTPHDPALSGRTVVGYMTGADSLQGAIDGLTYAPGAVACNLTSFGAVPQNFVCDASGAICPASESQTSIARFVRAGATAAHGTVAEPLNNSFPAAGALTLYASGYSLGESFLYAQEFLYWQNLLLGDPLATPFAERPVVSVPATVAVGATLDLVGSHPDGVVEVRLYVGGVRVADADAETLSWMNDRAEGEVLDVLAVAVAGDQVLDRPGWPVASQIARTETQGWTHTSVTVVAGEPPIGDDDDDHGSPVDEVEEPGGCGCAGAPGSSGLLVLLVLLGVRGGQSRAGR